MKTSSAEIYELHAVIRGRIQGVGFRALTRRQARQLGLKGTVHNLSDGTVEIYAQGPKQHLEQLLEQLHTEIHAGQIDDISCDYSLAENFFSDFQII